MNLPFFLVVVFLIGCVCGLRSMTAPALVCIAAHLGWLPLAGSHLQFLGYAVSAVIFALLAVGELIADKMTWIPSRIEVGPLFVRFLFGAVCGAAFSVAAHQSHFLAVLLGSAGAVVGAFAGYGTRRWLTTKGKLPDLPVALAEDAIAILGGLFLVTRF